jgi:hypothetical protein
MGEAKRKRETAVALTAVREMLWTTIGDAAGNMGLQRGDLLALLNEKALILGGLTEAEVDHFIERMEAIDEAFQRWKETHEKPPPATALEVEEGAILPPLPNTGDPREEFEQQRPSEKLGDQPVEEQHHAKMTTVVQLLDTIFNGKIGGRDRKIGFVVMVFPYGDAGGRCNYMSNGADRRRVATLMKEMVARFEGQPEMTGRA